MIEYKVIRRICEIKKGYVMANNEDQALELAEKLNANEWIDDDDSFDEIEVLEA